MKKIWSILMAAMILCLAVSVPSWRRAPHLEPAPLRIVRPAGWGIHREPGDPQ